MRRGKHVALPAAVSRALEGIFGAEAVGVISHVRVVEHSLFARMHGRAVATTRRRRIFLRGSAAEFFSDPTLMLHEYCHVLHQWEPGSLTTLRYVQEWLRRGYWNNRFEIEARDFARKHEGQLREMLSSRVPRVNLAAERGQRIGSPPGKGSRRQG